MSPAKRIARLAKDLVGRVGDSVATKKTTKKTSAKKVTARKPVAKKTTAKKSTPRKATAKKSTVKKATAKKATVRKPVAKKTTARKPPAKKTTPKKKSMAKKPVARKPAPKKPTAPKKATGKKTIAKKTTAKKTTAKGVPAPTEVKQQSKPTTKAAPLKGPLISRPPAPQKPTPRPAKPIKLEKAQLNKIRADLQQEKADLEQRLTDLEAASFESSQSDMTGEAGLSEDFADAGTATFDRERDLSIRNNVLDLIDQVTRALRRIDEGLYGTCESCGNPIDAARIRAFPRVLLCLDCKRREERTR